MLDYDLAKLNDKEFDVFGLDLLAQFLGQPIDAVTLHDGQHLLVYNHTEKGRSPLNVAVSSDAKNLQAALLRESEPGEYSYPAVIQTSDGLVHAVYTWKRQRIKHVVIDPAKLVLQEIAGGKWPA